MQPDQNQHRSTETPAAFAPKRLALITLAMTAVIYVAAVIATLYFDIGMGIHGYIAMALGIFATLALGIGLMGLLFYSARHGYDDDHHISLIEESTDSNQPDNTKD